MAAAIEPSVAIDGLIPDGHASQQRWHREWMTPDGHVAVGLDTDGMIDEVLTGDGVHIERMDERAYWMRVGDLHLHFVVPRTGPRRIILDIGEWQGPE